MKTSYNNNGLITRKLDMRFGLLLCFLFISLTLSAQEDKQQTTVTIKTNVGNIQLALYNQQTPATVRNFLTYVNDGFYNKVLFHRVTASLAQAGLYNNKYKKKSVEHPPIINEAKYSSNHRIGTVAMMRGRDPHSATSQFFINTANNQQRLSYASSTVQGWGYVVFGEVIKGMDVVEKIAQTKTGAVGSLKKYVPKTKIMIKSIKINYQAEIPATPQVVKKIIVKTKKAQSLQHTLPTPIIDSTTEQWSPEPPDVPAVE